MLDKSTIESEEEQIIGERDPLPQLQDDQRDQVNYLSLVQGGHCNQGNILALLQESHRKNYTPIPVCARAHVGRRMTHRTQKLFSLVESGNIIGLNEEFNHGHIDLEDFDLKNEKGQSLMERIVDVRYQRLMNFFFDIVVIPNYKEDGKINLKNADQYKNISLLDYAVFFNQVEFIEDNKAEIVKDRLFSALTFSPDVHFHAAIQYDYLDMMVILIEQGASIHSSRGIPSLSLAARAGSVNAIDLLINYGAKNINVVSGHYTPLQWAMYYGHYHAFMCLIHHGAVIHPKWLHQAVRGGNVNIVEKMLAVDGLDINWVNTDGVTALELAIMQGSLPIFDLLVARGADVAECNANGDSGLHLAAMHRQIPILKRIIEMHIIDINLVNQSTNETPLHLALHEDAKRENASSQEVIALLLAHGANINAVACDADVEEGELSVERNTPLHYAVEMNDQEAVMTLLQQGAGVNLGKSDGRTLLDLALEMKNSIIIQALIKHGAKTSAQPTPEAIASAMLGVFASQKRSSDAEVDSPSKRVKLSKG